MKIEKVVIQNLNSIENAEINFSEGILAKEPLFLICGETGSGKSTILDAITLALYDKASRYENVKNKEKTENGNSNTKTTFNILRKGKNDGKAEVHFSVKDTHYIASWLVHKTRTNTYSSSDRRRLEIVDGDLKTTISNKIDVVNKTIEELIGLTYEQFIRSVMLAQGEFSTFLKSKKSEQSEILEMLTGTEIYSKIAESVKSKKGEAFYNKKEAETLYNSLKDKILTSNELDDLNEQYKRLSDNIKQNEIDIKLAESSIVWLKKNYELEKECNEIKSQHENITEQINSLEYQENQSVINDFFKTSKERESFKEYRRLELELSKINNNYDNDIRTFLNLNNSLQNEKKNKSKLISLSNEITNWIDNHNDDKYIYENINLILGVLNELSHISKLLDTKSSELKDNELKKKGIASSLLSLSQSLEEVKKIKLEAEDCLDKLLKDFNSEEYNNLIEELQKLNDERKAYSDRNAKLINIKTVLEQYLELDQNIKNENVKCDNIKSSFNHIKDVLLQRKNAFEAKDLEYQKQKDMIEDWAKEYRSKLKEGEPCPVCGSREHHYKDENIVNTLFSCIENEWKRLKESFENTKDKLNKTEAELNTILRNISTEEKRLEILLSNLNTLCNGNPIFDIDRIDVNIKKYNDLIYNIDEKTVVINEKLKNITLARNKINEAQNKKKVIDEKYNSVEKELSTKQIEHQQIELLLNTITTIIQEQKSKYDEKERLIDEYVKDDSWKQSFIKSSEDYIQHIKHVATEWQTKNESLKNNEIQIVHINEIIGQCERYVSETLKIIDKDINIEYVCTDVETQSLIPSFSANYEKIKERLSEKDRIEDNLKSIKKAIDDFIANNDDIDYERLKFISGIDDIQFLVQKNKALDDELIKYKNTLTIKTEEYNSHQNNESKPKGDITLEELELSLRSSTNIKKTNEETLSNIKMRLALNEQNCSNSDTYQKDFEEKDRIYHLWEQLAKAIGTTDGDNFRDVAQSYTMSILLNRANYYLKQLSNRYLLSCYPDSLAIMVQDMEMGGEMRTASSLSGGETFLVSLALALGLTSLNDEHFNMDMLFIDEGFGTLDNDSLDMVMNTLENLHSLGRRVGIISHVDTLKERIPAQIQLIREGKSASRVEVIKN